MISCREKTKLSMHRWIFNMSRQFLGSRRSRAVVLESRNSRSELYDIVSFIVGFIRNTKTMLSNQGLRANVQHCNKEGL